LIIGVLAGPVPLSPTQIFAPASTPARSIFELSILVLLISAAIFVVVFGLLAYAALKFRRRKSDDGREPPQIYGSLQIELAWTITPVIIVLVLFLATARVVYAVQDHPRPRNALEVTAIGHRFWWEYRYAGTNVVTANELHIPVSEAASPRPTYLKLLSADTDHSFWVPRLGGKTDLIPNFPNETWFDPQETGLFLGQCAQYCGTQHAKMLLRVYVHTREEFERWLAEQSKPAVAADEVAQGRRIFERTSCINCHTVAGTPANGRFGPDLTHLMSRDTIGAGILPNTPENLSRWIRDPAVFKPGSLMPAMGMSDAELEAVTAYMASLR